MRDFNGYIERKSARDKKRQRLTIKRIENNERIPRETFRNAERSGKLAPHVFVENPTDAVCQECDLVIRFEATIGKVHEMKDVPETMRRTWDGEKFTEL